MTQENKGIVKGLGESLSSFWNSSLLLRVAIIFWVLLIVLSMAGV